jgi:hypothetical protein
MRMAAPVGVDFAATVVVADGWLIVRLVYRPPHNPKQSADRDLEQKHHPDKSPGHVSSPILLPRVRGQRALLLAAVQRPDGGIASVVEIVDGSRST